MALYKKLFQVRDKVKRGFLLSSVGSGLISKLKILWAYFVWSVMRRLRIPNSPVLFKILVNGKEFECWLFDRSDISIFSEVFIEGEYDFIDIKKTPSVIVDLGSNSGYSVILFKSMYPNAKVFALEPAKKTFERLKLNTSQFLDSVIAEKKAISDKDGQLELFVNESIGMSSSVFNRGDNFKKEIVDSTTLESFMINQGIESIDLIKFDIEGAEELLFKQFSSFDRVGRIIGEVHYDLMSMSRVEFLSLFKDFKVDTFPSSRNSHREIVDIHCDITR